MDSFRPFQASVLVPGMAVTTLVYVSGAMRCLF